MGNGSSGRLWQRVKRRDRSLGPASAVRPGRGPEVEAEALANLVTRIYRFQGAPGELPGRTLVTERAAAVGLAGLAVKPGSVAEACGVPNIPRIGHNASDDRVHSRTGSYAHR
jgi:hypothetical protein